MATAQGLARVAEANRQATSGQVGGAVTRSGQIVQAGGKVVGGSGTTGPKLSSADVATPGPQDVAGTEPIQPQDQQLAPTDQAPKNLVNQVNQAQTQVDALAKQKGLTLQKTATGGYTAVPDQKAQYEQALAQTKGQEAPQSMGAGASMVNQSLKQVGGQTEQPSVWPTIFQDEPNIEKPLLEYDDLMSPPKQRESLVSEYQKMSKSLGLDEINAELINDKNIIEGSEDDIRNEITGSGGLATDSQVQAMANARNKSLIKNYNTLLDTKNALTTQLSTMMQLSVQDRQFAEAEFDRKLNYAFKVAEFKERATTNARNGLQWSIEQGLGAEILKNPYETRLAEKTLGVPAGGLAGIIQKKAQESNLEANYKQAQIDKIYGDIATKNAENQVIVDQSGKVLLKAEEGRKLNKELVNSDAFKSINKAQDSLQFLNNFEQSFNKFGATSAIFDPIKNSKMKAEYNAAILNLKEFFNLGVLNGPDEAILKGVLPDPTSRSNTLRMLSLGTYNPKMATENGLASMKEMIETTLDDRFRTTMASYGDYSTESVGAVGDTMRKYVDAKASLNPEVKTLLDENPELSYEEIIEIITQ